MSASARFRDRAIVFANGVAGLPLEVPTANPVNYHQAMSDPGAMARTAIDGQLFLPPGASGPVPAAIVVPGSLGVAPSHLAHAETLTGMGIAAFVIDPFGARGVTSTVANQVQYSFAASAYDVVAALAVLNGRPEIDRARVGAQGHSRGGSAVLTAAMRRFADPALGGGPRLKAVYAGYPWCGHQFLDPFVGDTVVRAIAGDRDGWCLPQQTQGYIQAIRLRGGVASMRIVAGAAHSFDRGTAVTMVADASVAPGAPTGYVADDGAFSHPVEGVADARLTDRDIMIYGMKAGDGVRGATIGSLPGEADVFREDMVRFWRETLLDGAGG